MGSCPLVNARRSSRFFLPSQRRRPCYLLQLDQQLYYRSRDPTHDPKHRFRSILLLWGILVPLGPLDVVHRPRDQVSRCHQNA
jgi:hypothetical protein